MNLSRFIPLLLVSFCLLPACKKEGDYPAEIRPRDFYVHCTLVNEQGVESPYEYRGEDTIALHPAFVLDLGYLGNSYIQDSLRHIWAGLGVSFFPMPFFISITHPERVTDPFTVPEWQAGDFEDVLYTGKTFTFGPGPGEATIGIADFPNGNWSFNTQGVDNTDSYLQVLEVTDYGMPELGTPYFGKKVHFKFSCKITNSSGATQQLRQGEAVLLFRYYQF